MSNKGRNILVIGTSAGGLDALDKLLVQLNSDLPASIFLVVHLSPENNSVAFLQRLSRNKAFECKLARDGESFERGKIYIAPPDYHLLVKQKTLLVTKGARENRFRPAIDPLFRSAAVSHGPSVIGVVLTGLLDDGTAGLIAIKRCGGVTIVQDPKDAEYSEMPRSAMNNLKVDYCVPLAGMGNLIEKLCNEAHGKEKNIPDDVRSEAEIAERVLSDVAQVNALGSQVPYNCPNCGGVLWEMDQPVEKRYRCHTGHSYTETALHIAQTEKIEETLWICLRMLEERKNLMNNMTSLKKLPSYADRIKENDSHIERIRDMLLTRDRKV